MRYYPINKYIAVVALLFGSVACAPSIGADYNSYTPEPSYVSADPPPPIPQKAAYVRPTKADNGVPFPTTSGYIDGYPAEAIGGYSSVTVDNSENDSDVFVKLYALDGDSPKPASVFFILAGEQFTVEDIQPGKYDVRHQNLDSGALSKTESFDLTTTEVADGFEYTVLSLTLYNVEGGTMESYPISKNEF
jgi:hypothetical protein